VTILTDSEWRKLARDLSRRVGVAVPDWTNTDASDPSVTMAELIGFLAESLLDRPDRSPRAQTRLTAVVGDLADRVRDGSCGDVRPLTRNRYFYGKLMSVDDFTLEQEYVRGKGRRHNLLLHGVGIAWGLEVTVEPGPTTGDQVVVSPGLAIGPTGEELLVCEPITIALGPIRSPSYVTLGLVDRPFAVVPTPDGEEASHVEEVTVVDVLPDLPASRFALARVKRTGRRWRLDPTFKAPHQDG
jgi:hypothetical protein